MAPSAPFVELPVNRSFPAGIDAGQPLYREVSAGAPPAASTSAPAAASSSQGSNSKGNSKGSSFKFGEALKAAAADDGSAVTSRGDGKFGDGSSVLKQ
jgi:hypothetical protein